MSCSSLLRPPLVFLSTLVLLTLALPSSAQLPSESLLIVNGSSATALRVANEYIHLRSIPAERILMLYPEPDFFLKEDGSPRWTVPEGKVRTQLLSPVRDRLDALEDASPTALILSPGWPTRVPLKGKPAVSITYFLGSDGDMPEAARIKSGSAISPWFTHPDQLAKREKPLIRYPIASERIPGLRPAAMLGVSYPPLDTGDIVQALQRARKADFTRPGGAVAVVTNQNVRSKARLSQFKPFQSRLEAKGVPVRVGPAGMDLPENLTGVMTGAASVQTAPYRDRLVPGAFAEHLTSFAAHFDAASQTKLTEWIAAGAAGSVGTVTEPYAIWRKFPMVDIFDRYQQGNTLLEALMQSIASPVQSLIVGDPLCRPWGEALPKLSLTGKWSGEELVLIAEGIRSGSGTDLHLFVDGKRISGNGPVWRITPEPDRHGPELDIILHARRLWAPPEVGSVHQRFQQKGTESLSFSVKQKDGRLQAVLKSRQPMLFWEVQTRGKTIWTAAEPGKKVQPDLPVQIIGTGPVTLRAKGVTADGRVIFSAYKDLNLSD